MRFADIPQFTRGSSYFVNIDLKGLPRHLHWYVTHYKLDVSPDFQRNYVWTPEQKVRYMEFFLRGGKTGRDIYINCVNWQGAGEPGPCVLVDGKQRMDAALGFLNNEFSVFGHFYREFTDKVRMHAMFNWHVHNLDTREEVLQWYLDLNTGGTVHSEDELTRVRALLSEKVPFPQVDAETVARHAGMDRQIMQETAAEVAADEARRAADYAERQRLEALQPKRKASVKKKR